MLLKIIFILQKQIVTSQWLLTMENKAELSR